MTTADYLTIAAIILGPIFAVQVQKLIEKLSEKKKRRLDLFKTLMGTRRMRLSFEHVRALNMIDMEFHKEKAITDAWKSYLDSLIQKMGTSQIELPTVAKDQEDKFFVLLKEMAKYLKYDFDMVHLKNAAYSPIAHGKEDEYQLFVRDNIKKLFNGEQSIPITVTQIKSEQQTKDESHK